MPCLDIPSRLAFVDLETTGANPRTDRITEIGLVLVDGEQVETWSSLVNPGIEISPFISELTGITNAMVASAPAFATLAETVLSRLRERLFIAHNARFDYGFLKQEFARAGLRFHARTLCTVKLSRTLFPEHKKHNLDALMQRHGLKATGRHRALADARLIHQFWQGLWQNPGAAALGAALAEQLSAPPLPPGLSPEAIADVPDSLGVYCFYGADDLPLYVGRAKDMHQRILKHFANPRERAMHAEIQRLDWRTCASELGAQLLEARWVKTRQPRYNRHLRPAQELLTWQLLRDAAGCLRPRLTLADTLDFSPEAACYGLFKTQHEALATLRALATAQRLCPMLLGLESGTPGHACSAVSAKRCKGACLGREPRAAHDTRLLGALARLELQPWPYPGPALLREAEALHVVDAWRYLGCVHDMSDIPTLLACARPAFDKDIYRLLVPHITRFTALKQPRAWGDA